MNLLSFYDINQDMLVCYDIDGTVTKEGIDLWYESFVCSVNNLKEFELKIQKWKESSNKLEESYKLMKYSIDNVTKKDLLLNAEKYIDFVLKNNLYRKDAIKSISKNCKIHNIKFLTTNIQEIAELFIDKLLLKYNINNSNIEVVGTSIDWDSKSINHFNMGKNKIVNINEEVIKAYGDDPFFNDKEMLELAMDGFVVVNSKNKEKNVIYLKKRFGNEYTNC